MKDIELQDSEGFNQFTHVENIKQQVEKMRKRFPSIKPSYSSLQSDETITTNKKKPIVPNEL